MTPTKTQSHQVMLKKCEYLNDLIVKKFPVQTKEGNAIERFELTEGKDGLLKIVAVC